MTLGEKEEGRGILKRQENRVNVSVEQRVHKRNVQKVRDLRKRTLQWIRKPKSLLEKVHWGYDIQGLAVKGRPLTVD